MVLGVLWPRVFEWYLNSILMIFFVLCKITTGSTTKSYWNIIEWYWMILNGMQWYTIGSFCTECTLEIIVPLYEVFQDDMPGDRRQLQNEVGRWKTRWDMMNVAERHSTTRFKKSTPINMYTAVVILMVMSASTATADKSALSAQCSVSTTICALQWQLCACRGWP